MMGLCINLGFVLISTVFILRSNAMRKQFEYFEAMYLGEKERAEYLKHLLIKAMSDVRRMNYIEALGCTREQIDEAIQLHQDESSSRSTAA